MRALARILNWTGIALAVVGLLGAFVPVPGLETSPLVFPLGVLPAGIVLITAGVGIRLALGFIAQRRRAAR